MILPVILAGGSGTRLWPLSRESYPKQFISLLEEKSLFQSTIQRLNNIPHLPPIIICNQEHRFIVAEQLRNINAEVNSIILEPEGKNTAPALAIAAMKSLQDYDDPTLLILSADHHISQLEPFEDAINTAKLAAKKGKIVTFGVIPTSPHTGYGYIKKGIEHNSHSFEIEKFVEKPDLATAQAYLATNNYFWNSGMFVMQAKRYLADIEKLQPTLFQTCQLSLDHAKQDLDFVRLDAKSFSNAPNISIDYAVMEHTTNAVVVPLGSDWSDVGSWQSLWQLNDKDPDGNVINGDVISINSQNNFVQSESSLIATLNVNDLIIVETKDALLVAHKDKTEEIKQVVEKIKLTNRSEHKIHREVYRPWGKYDAIDKGYRYQVKHITVNPGEQLSSQMHHHRAEHWVIVSGTAKVSIDDKISLLTENQSTYIPIGATHRLENPGKLPLELIEIQSGAYLEEDDIIRFDDRYHRIDDKN